MRPLLRDYVEMLLLTGMRHGTEAMGICWRHLDWHTDKGVRYLRIWVDGKTGGRWLIANHRAVAVLERLHARQKDICELSFETTFTQRVPHKLFRFIQAADAGHRLAEERGRAEQDALQPASHLRYF
jgi:integrase